MSHRRRFLTRLMALSALLASDNLLAQARTVRIVVPFAAGGVQDILARSISNELRMVLGQTVVVENRPGAGGTIGTGAVAKAEADGSVMVLAAASHNIAASLYPKLPYHPLKDFTPLAHIGTASYVLMIHPGVPARSVAEYIAYARTNPGKLNYASAGNGSATHLSMAYFNSLAGLDVVHVPLKATGEAINEVISGRAHAVIAATIAALAFTQDSRLRLLGSTSPTRTRFLPALQTIAESGLPGYQFDSWFGLLGPAGVPASEADRINAAIAQLLGDPLVLERLERQGAEPRAMSNAEFARLLATDAQRMAAVVKASGARID